MIAWGVRVAMLGAMFVAVVLLLMVAAVNLVS